MTVVDDIVRGISSVGRRVGPSGRAPGQAPAPVPARLVGAARDGDGRRARPVRRRDRRGERRARAPGVRPRHRAHAQLRRRGSGHAQLDLQIPRGGLPEPDEVRGDVPRGVDHPHGAELPLQPAHPRRRQRGDRQQRGAPSQAPLDRADRRRAHHPLPRRGRARRGRVRGARDRPAGRHRAPPLRRRRGLLPHQRAEPRDRGVARARRRAVPRRRRREVLRPARGEGRPRLPAGAGEPRRRGELAPRGEHAQAWRRRHVGEQGVRVRAGSRHHVPRRARARGRGRA